MPVDEPVNRLGMQKTGEVQYYEKLRALQGGLRSYTGIKLDKSW